MKKYFYTLLLILSLTFLLVACSDKTVYYTVTAYYDEQVYLYNVEENGLIDFKPAENEDFMFIGWYNEDYSECLDNKIVTSNMNVYAKLIKIGSGYNITYDLDGGEFQTKQVRRYVVGKTTTLPTAIKNPNFEFVGWMVNGNESSIITEISDTTYGDISLKAKYIDHNTYCSISYELNGGTMVGDAITTYRVGDENFINCAYSKKDGYYFKGWYLEPTFNTLVRSISSTQTGDIKLYAKFEEATKENTYLSFLGDSITTFEGEIPEGYITYYPAGDVTSKTKTWWYMANEKLGYTILQNNSFSGSKVSPTTDPRPNSYSSCYERLQYIAKGDEYPDVLIINMGTNDFTNGISAPTFKESYIKMIEMIRYYYDDVKIYVCLQQYNKYESRFIQVRLDFNAIISEIATTYNLTVIDFSKVITEENVESMMYAGAHPNYNGMKAMADLVYEIVSK